MGKKHFYFFQTAETGNRTPNSGVKGSGANHYPRAPALATEGSPKSELHVHCMPTQENHVVFTGIDLVIVGQSLVVIYMMCEDGFGSR